MAESAGKKPEVDPARAQGSAPKPTTSGDGAKPRPKVVPLEGVVAKKVKPPLSARLRQAFTNDDARSVGDYLLFEVAIPAIKATLFDLIQGGASRALWGTGVPTRQAQRGGPSINYNQISRTTTVGPQGVAAQRVDPQSRSGFNFEGVVFPTRVGAERALTVMMETIEQYQVFAVSDLYEMVNITGSWADDKWGWYNLQGADIVPVHNGFILDLPPVQPIK